MIRVLVIKRLVTFRICLLLISTFLMASCHREDHGGHGNEGSVLKDYERSVLDLLAPSALSPEQIEAVIREGTFVSCDYSGCGYFLTLAHPSLPKERKVCDEPPVMGHADGIDCGFILFIEGGELTIECYTWGAIEVPEGFRERDVRVEIATNVFRPKDT